MWYLCWVSFKLQVHYNKDHHERVDLVITASMNIYHTKTKYSNSNENMLFWRITDKTIWNSSFQLTPLYLSNFFMIPLFVWILKIKPPHLILGVGGNVGHRVATTPGNSWKPLECNLSPAKMKNSQKTPGKKKLDVCSSKMFFFYKCKAHKRCQKIIKCHKL